jgi:hypothetical protein
MSLNPSTWFKKKNTDNILTSSDVTTILNLCSNWASLERELADANKKQTRKETPYIHELIISTTVGNLDYDTIKLWLQSKEDRSFSRLGEVYDVLVTIFGIEKMKQVESNFISAQVERGYDRKTIETNLFLAPQLCLSPFIKIMNSSALVNKMVKS